nr:MAG TPA: hypothetical protein [Caudoviricetes sp.]
MVPIWSQLLRLVRIYMVLNLNEYQLDVLIRYYTG